MSKIAVITGNRINASLIAFASMLNTAHYVAKEKGASLTVLVGDAPSDRHVQAVCKEEGVDTVVFRPFHLLDGQTEFNPRLFFIRNRQMIQNADFLHILTDGDLSADMNEAIRQAIKRGIPHLIF